MKSIIIHYILKRLTEASTLKGLILAISGAFGVALSQDQTNSAVWIILGIVGMIGSLLPDKFERNKKPESDVPNEEPSIVPIPPYEKDQPTTETGWGDK